MTARLAVIGHPIAHSLSPRMHGAALATLGIDARYEAIDVPLDALEDAVRALRADPDTLGWNVTLPHKESIVRLLDAIDDDARAIGAVNTVYREGGRWLGTNTDARGLLRSLEEEGVRVGGARVTIVGAGGAARAAAFAMQRAGASAITVAARRPAQAEAIAAALGAPLQAVALDALGSLAACDLLVQASSATLGSESGRILADGLDIASLPVGATVVDLVYRPRRTAVLSAAQARGLRTVDGVGMLVHQGALALERWLGRPAPIDVMRAAIDAAL